MVSKIHFAVTTQGVRLPVIDVTHPTFALNPTEEELDAMSAKYVLEAAYQQEIPPAVREALQRSGLGSVLMASSGTFLPGMATYLLKLGPDNLASEASLIDRRIAASFPALTARLRLQDMARLLADGVSRIASPTPLRPLLLLNIAGGPSSDSWNALIHLQTGHPGLLTGRQINIAVLDPDHEGPAFGGRAIVALRAPSAPLAGLDIRFRRFDHCWSQVERVEEILGELHAADSACAASSEGGLFEYGSDREILSNLQTLRAHTAPDAFIVGSVTRDGEPVRASRIASRIATIARTLEAFTSIVEEAGWAVDHVIERPFSFHVRLLKA